MKYLIIIFAFIPGLTAAIAASSNSNLKDSHLINKPHLSTHVLQKALLAYQFAQKNTQLNDKGLITIIDFDLPSYIPRAFVYNIKTKHVIFQALVAHGKGSGHGAYATHFSNKANSDASSLGVYVTQNTYTGKHGQSMRLNGLEHGLNDHALQRSVVIHSAWYVNKTFAKEHHRIGNSWGCFAFSPKAKDELISLIGSKSVLFAYQKSEDEDKNLNDMATIEPH
jgi:hypothetical protein